MSGSSIITNKPLRVSTGADPEYSVEEFLNAVTAKIILNLGPKPIKSTLHQSRILKRTDINHARLCSSKTALILTVDIKSDWKRFTKTFLKMVDSERNIKEFYEMKFADSHKEL